MMSEESKAVVLDAVREASGRWQSAFNAGNAAGCAAEYETTAVMHARPFGTFSGKTEIQGFWQKIIDNGFGEVEYVNPKIDILDEKRRNFDIRLDNEQSQRGDSQRIVGRTRGRNREITGR